MVNTLVLDKDFGYEQFRYSGDANIIDATGARFTVANMGDQINRYPFLVEDLPDGAQLKGGVIDGELSLTMDWVDLYVNSAAVLVRDTPKVEVTDWTIDRAWDGIRISWSSDDFVISGAYMTQIRDDAIESDDGNSGTIRDCFFDGVFSSISLADEGTPDSSHKIVTIDNVLVRMETYDYKGRDTHCSPIKLEETSPSLQIYNSVFAISDLNHIRQSKTQLIWDKTVDAADNYYLNLSGEPFPADYPLPGEGWTVLEGQEAQDFYDARVDEWHAQQASTEPEQEPGAADDQTGPQTSPTPIEPEEEDQLPPENIFADSPSDPPIVGDAGDNNINGSNADETILGLEGADRMFGLGGADTLDGGTGNDVVFGGAGDDLLSGGEGNDTAFGEQGNDTLNGGGGNDKLLGGEDHDDLTGEAGSDQLFGGAGHDLLNGGEDADSLFGGAGDDTLDGGRGTGIDRATGGQGADIFVFQSGDARLVITDFDATQGDRIELVGIDPAEFQNWTLKSLGGGSKTLIEFGNGDELRLDGISPAELDEGWFQ